MWLTLLIPFMAIMARASGGGLFGPWLREKLGSFGSRVPETMFAAPFGAAAWLVSGSVWCGLASWVWSYFAMEMGHGNAYHMGFTEKNFPDRWQTLDYIVRPITSRLGFAPRSAGYCWVFMGLKGLLIGLPLGWFALALAVMWPAAYWISFRFTRSSELAEWLSGACAGFIVFCAIAHHALLAERLGAEVNLQPTFSHELVTLENLALQDVRGSDAPTA